MTTQQTIKRGSRLVELLKQAPFSPICMEHQLLLLFAGRNGYLDSLDFEQIDGFKEILSDCFNDPEFEDFKFCFIELFTLEDEITRDLTLHQIVSDFVAIAAE